MKKLLPWVFCVLLLALGWGCAPAAEEPPPPPQREYGGDTYVPSGVRPAPYTALSYGGIDTNPQNHPNTYHVNNDSSFVADIWNALDLGAWTEQAEGSAAMVTIELTFSDENSFLSVEIDPNDTGWRKSEGYDHGAPEYFSLPAGTYDRVKFLLTTYTATHFMPDVSLKLLEIDINSPDPIVFDRGEIHFLLPPRLAGEFTQSWNTAAWEEQTADCYLSSDDAISIHSVYCRDGRGPVEITVDREQKCAGITYDGVSKRYSVPEETVQAIYNQFDELHLLAQDQPAA